MENIKTKICSCCKVEKDINKFEHSIKNNKTYIRNKCFSCRHKQNYKYSK